MEGMGPELFFSMLCVTLWHMVSRCFRLKRRGPVTVRSNYTCSAGLPFGNPRAMAFSGFKGFKKGASFSGYYMYLYVLCGLNKLVMLYHAIGSVEVSNGASHFNQLTKSGVERLRSSVMSATQDDSFTYFRLFQSCLPYL